ncbi:MAG: hypothetical protein JO051_03290 [Acidobacteriaceae bacterium]|nr:hypothetical protein [Acidobacteriaceae bacterium]
MTYPRDLGPSAGKFYVAKIDANDKIERVMSGELSFEEARELAKKLTVKFEPVRVSHWEYLKDQRERRD